MNNSSNFIPSPFRVVTEYEEEFVRLWRENNSRAMVMLIDGITKLHKDVPQ